MSKSPPIVETRGFDDIATNILFSIPIALILILILCLCRSRAASTLLQNRNNAVEVGGMFGWAQVVIKVNDLTFQSISGIDGFITIQMVKMLLVMMICLCLPIVVILMPLYYLFSSNRENVPTHDFGEYLFYNLSIMVLPSHLLWIPMLISYFTTIITFYFVYVFFCKFLVLHHAFLRQPSVFTNYFRLKMLKSAFGEDSEKARLFLDSRTRALIISGVSSKQNLLKIVQLFKNIGEIETLQFVKSKAKLKRYLEKRNYYHEKLEQAYKEFYTSLLEHIKEKLGSDNIVAFEKFVETLQRPVKLSATQKIRIIDHLKNPNFLKSVRPTLQDNVIDVSASNNDKHNDLQYSDESSTKQSTNKFSNTKEEQECVDKTLMTVNTKADGNKKVNAGENQNDKILYYYKALLHRDNKYLQELSRFNSDSDEDIIIDSRKSSFELPPTENDVESGDSLEADQKFIGQFLSISDYYSLKKSLRDFKLTVWGTGRNMIIVFKHASCANLARQVLLSWRPFSMMPQYVFCSSDELIWSNLYLPPADRLLKRVGGEIMYIFLNIVFLVTAIFIGSLLQLEQLERTFPFLSPFFDPFPGFRNIIRGVLAPLGLTICFLLVPYLLRAMALFYGLASKTEVEGWIIVRYSWFLVIQLAVIAFFPNSNFLEVIQYWTNGDWREKLSTLQSNLPYKAVLFINSTIQKTFISLAIQMTKPIQLITFAFKGKAEETRSGKLLREPSEFQFSTIYPELLIFVYLSSTAFMLVTPVFLLFSILFFATAFFVLKTKLLYSDMVMFESGGKYWRLVSKHILSGIIMSQTFLLFQMLVNRRVLECILMLPLIAMTMMGISKIEAVFEAKLDKAPSTNEDIETITDVLNASKRMQDFVFVNSDKGNDNMVPITMQENTNRVISDCDTKDVANPYINPLILKRSVCIDLPNGFLNLLDWIISRNQIVSVETVNHLINTLY